MSDSVKKDASETWVEWGVERTWGDVGSVASFGRDRRTAEKCAHDWPGLLVSRGVTARPWTHATPAAARLKCECVAGPHGGYTCEGCR